MKTIIKANKQHSKMKTIKATVQTPELRRASTLSIRHEHAQTGIL